MTIYGHIKALNVCLVNEALIALDSPIRTELPLTQSHALIRKGGDYADLFALGFQQNAELRQVLQLSQYLSTNEESQPSP